MLPELMKEFDEGRQKTGELHVIQISNGRRQIGNGQTGNKICPITPPFCMEKTRKLMSLHWMNCELEILA